MSSAARQSGPWHDVREHKRRIINVGREAARGGALSRPVEWLGRLLSHPLFFLAMVVSHLGWPLWNSGWLPLPVFDPHPFTLLATVASVEAPLLSVLVLMYQRRKHTIDEVRQETDVQIALHDERETTKLLKLVADIHRAMNLDPSQRDETLERMMEPLKAESVVEDVEEEQD